MYVTNICPTCGAGSTAPVCDHCGQTITDTSTAHSISPIDGGTQRLLCGTCSQLPLAADALGS